MDFKTKKLSDVAVELTVKNTADEVDEAFRAAYRKAQAKFKLPGFRPGKVPLELVEKHLGDSVADDAARELIASTFQQIVEDLDPQPISIPRFELESFDRSKGAVYKGEYETLPRFKLQKYKKLKVNEDEVEVADADIQAELERLQKERGALVSREGGAQKDDVAILDIVVKDGAKVLYKNKELRAQLGGSNTLPGVDEQLYGLAVGESKQFEITIDETFPDGKFAGKTLSVEVVLTENQYPEYPEINDEFARDMGEYETLDQLKAKLRETLLEQAKTAVKQKTMQNLLDQVVEGVKFAVPNALIDSETERRLERMRERLGQKNASLADIAAMAGQDVEKMNAELRASSEKAIRERLVLRELTETESIQVGPEDILAEIRNRFGAYLPENQLPTLLENEQLRDDVEGRLLFWKSLEFLYENAEVRKGARVGFAALREQGILN